WYPNLLGGGVQKKSIYFTKMVWWGDFSWFRAGSAYMFLGGFEVLAWLKLAWAELHRLVLRLVWLF
ncbi:hypothetical protein ACQWHJ_26990, partial [Salmonella enterica subsp. enterica serovar Infantis]